MDSRRAVTLLVCFCVRVFFQASEGMNACRIRMGMFVFKQGRNRKAYMYVLWGLVPPREAVDKMFVLAMMTNLVGNGIYSRNDLRKSSP